MADLASIITLNNILAGVQILTLIALIIYVVKTWQMASATKNYAKTTEKTLDEMKETRVQESAPYVVVYFDFIGHEIYLVVENVGKGLAKDVKIEFRPELENTGQGKKINDTPMIKDGIGSIPPNYKIRHFFDMSFAYYEKKLPLEYKVKISYNGGLTNIEKTTENVLDLAFHQKISFLGKKGMNELVKEIETLNKNNANINENLRKLSDFIGNGIWINNSDFFISELDNSDQWIEKITSISAQFELLWTSVYNEDPDKMEGQFFRDLKINFKVIANRLSYCVSNHPEDVDQKVVNNLVDISSKLLDLSNFTFYGDGGLSVNKFNSLGKETVDLIEKLNAELG